MTKKKNVKEKIMQHNVIKGEKNLFSVNGCQIRDKMVWKSNWGIHKRKEKTEKETGLLVKGEL